MKLSFAKIAVVMIALLQLAAIAPAAQAQGLNNIQHVVFIVKENRSFDQMFGAYWSWLNGGNPPPNAYFTTTAKLSTGATINMGTTPDSTPQDVCHDWPCLIAMLDNGKMDTFNLDPTCPADGGLLCLTQQNSTTIPNYYAYAKNFALGANVFSSIHATSFPNHLYTISASSGGIIGQGHLGSDRQVGCESAQGATALFLDQYGNITNQFPCVDINTLGDLLTAKNISWLQYAPPKIIFNPYTAINHIYNGSQWKTNIVDNSQFVTDAKNGNLPAVSWLVANHESEHPPFSTCYGENWTVNQINAVMSGPEWSSTAIFLMWDDPGGFYDHIAPPYEDQFGLGERLPFVIISPYAKPGYISTTQYEPSSVLKFIEERFGLPSLNGRDVNANDMLDSFNFNQTPNPPLVLNTRACPYVVSQQTYQPQQVGTKSPAYLFTYSNSNTETMTDTVKSITTTGDFSQTNNCGAIYPGSYCTITSYFSPTAAGTRTGTITITDVLGSHGTQTTHTINLTGTGTAIGISPGGTVTFPATAVGTTSAPMAVKLSNAGSTNLTVSSIVASSSFSQTNNCTSIAPLASCTINVTFSPTVAGNIPGTLVITDSDVSSPQTVNLTGLGATIFATPTSLTFGSTPQGMTSAAQSVTFTNKTAGAIPITSVGISGTYDTGDFAETDNCSGSLGPNASCTAQVTFTPTHLGPTSGPTTLLASFQSPDSPLAVSLAGNGTASTNKPAPALSMPTVPGSAVPGSPSFTMKVYGTNFSSTSVVNWNGTPLATKYQSPKYLQASVLASMLTTATSAKITVSTPAPGGGVSNTIYFEVAQPQSSVTFTTSTIGVGTNPQGIVTGDFNGDGLTDVAVANQGSNSVSILLGNGDGTFTPGTTITTGSQPGAMVAADFNGDGKLDLAIADNANSRILTVLGNGDGTFTPAKVMNCNLLADCGNTVDPTALAAGDFNGDGHVDLAVVNQSVNTISILLGVGDGTFRSQSTPAATLTNPLGIYTGDFNSDGKVDLAVTSASSITILVGNGNGTFKQATPLAVANPVALITADFNNDQKVDIAAVSGSSNSIVVFLGNGNATFTAGTSYPTGAGPAAIAAGDFNGDGILDLVTANSGSNTISLLPGMTGGSFGTHVETNVGGAPVALAVGDFNHNGKLDLAVSDSTGNSVSIALQ